MSHLVCPLCGKNAPLSTLNPSVLDLDLKVVSFQGLGRGKGFKVSEKWSILGDDDVTPVISERIVDLCKMLVNEGIIKKDRIAGELGIRASESPTVKKLENELSKEKGFMEKMKIELAAAQRGYNIQNNRANRLLELIRDNVRKTDELSDEEEWEHGVDNPLQALPERIQQIIQTYKETLRELDEAETKLENLNDTISEIVSDIEDATEHTFDENDYDTNEDLLKDAVNLIIDEFESVKAGMEE